MVISHRLGRPTTSKRGGNWKTSLSDDIKTEIGRTPLGGYKRGDPELRRPSITLLSLSRNNNPNRHVLHRLHGVPLLQALLPLAPRLAPPPAAGGLLPAQLPGSQAPGWKLLQRRGRCGGAGAPAPASAAGALAGTCCLRGALHRAGAKEEEARGGGSGRGGGAGHQDQDRDCARWDQACVLYLIIYSKAPEKMQKKMQLCFLSFSYMKDN